MAKTRPQATAKPTSPEKAKRTAALKTSDSTNRPIRNRKPSPKKVAATQGGLRQSSRMAPEKSTGHKAPPMSKTSTKQRVPAAKTASDKKLKATMSRKLQPGDESDGSSYHGYSTANILGAIDRRTLTKLDRILLEAINKLEENPSTSSIPSPFSDEGGTSLNCHYHIYWRFQILNQASESSDDTLVTSEPRRKSPAKGASLIRRSSKSPSNIDDAPQLNPSKRRRSEKTIERPFRSPTAVESPHTPGRLKASDGRIQKGRPRQSSVNLGFDKGHRSDVKNSVLKQAKQRAYQDRLNGGPLEPFEHSAASRRGVLASDFKGAQQEGADKAKVELRRKTRQERTRRDATQLEQGFSDPDMAEQTTQGVSTPGKGQTPRTMTARTPPTKKPSSKDPEAQAAKKEVKERNTWTSGTISFGSNEANRGKIFSYTNPPVITVENKKRPNPFFETMPAPEVWHRRMPPFFMFGETKYMEQKISDDINRDLNRTHTPEKLTEPQASASPLKAFAQTMAGMVPRILGRKTPEPPVSTTEQDPSSPKNRDKSVYDDPWALPPLDDYSAAPCGLHFASTSSPAKRRLPQQEAPPSKRARITKRGDFSTSVNLEDYSASSDDMR